MKKTIGLLAALAMALAAFGDEPTSGAPAPVETSGAGLVTIASKGKDVRDVLADLFNQAKRNFVLDSNVRQSLYLALTGVEFEETLEIVCKVANLEYEIQNGIYYVKAVPPAKSASTAKPSATPQPPKGKLPETVLTRKITTRFAKTDFRDVVKEIARQTNVRIEVDPAVPKRFVDAYLIDTSLKYGLDLLTTALGLEYKFSEFQSIVIAKPNPNRVVAIDANAK